jgi:hypothetical protein
MSATTVSMGRPVIRTATAGGAPSGRRRSARSTPSTRGGVRNPGTTRPARRASSAIALAAVANRIEEVVPPTSPIMTRGCDSQSRRSNTFVVRTQIVTASRHIAAAVVVAGAPTRSATAPWSNEPTGYAAVNAIT